MFPLPTANPAIAGHGYSSARRHQSIKFPLPIANQSNENGRGQAPHHAHALLLMLCSAILRSSSELSPPPSNRAPKPERQQDTYCCGSGSKMEASTRIVNRPQLQPLSPPHPPLSTKNHPYPAAAVTRALLTLKPDSTSLTRASEVQRCHSLCTTPLAFEKVLPSSPPVPPSLSGQPAGTAGPDG